MTRQIRFPTVLVALGLVLAFSLGSTASSSSGSENRTITEEGTFTPDSE